MRFKRGLYQRFLKCKRGMSVVLSTVILSSTLLVVVLSASGYANQLLQGEVQNAEFGQAKEVLLSLNKMVEKVTYAAGSSGYVKSGFITSYPSFTGTGKTLKLSINNVTLKEVNTLNIKIRGGQYVTNNFQDILGNSSAMVVGISRPIGWLYTNRSDKEDVILDYSRVRCVYKGLVQLYNGSGYESFNVIELTIISLTNGGIAYKDIGSFVVQNNGLETYQFQYTKNIQIRADYDTRSLALNLSQLGGNVNCKTLVNLFVLNAEVKIVQG